ncbi:hypothetical protein AAFN85_06680 [Mucilaginibacter sp. CAU 1740]|uniref:hypothetical protein n=1 Tax=Mucilaginibacter sp. CAU 1740 TaxID=3140365 RepID=UPI00325B254D
MMFDITGKDLVAIYISGPHDIYNNMLFVLFDLGDYYLFFDGWDLSIIADKSLVVLDNYQMVDHRILGSNLSIDKAFILESWWCYVVFNNGEAFYVYQSYNGEIWWHEYELILKSNTERYNDFIESISDEEVADRIDLQRLERYSGYKDINYNAQN